jgi:DNA-binding SARP family transcriptional activator
MPTLSAHLLGSLDVHAEDGCGELPAAHKAQELLCYLLLHRGRPIRREPLSCLLWTNADSRRSRKNLRQALWQLQSAIGHPAADEVLDVAAESVTLHSTANLWLDVEEFQAAVETIRRISAPGLDASEAAIADRAIRLYRGDLLEGFDFDWCLVEREWIKSAFLMLLDKLMMYCEAKCEYDRGIEYGERILRHDRAREYTHRRLMNLHHLRGDRTGALRQYARCSQALDEELGVLPAAATARLQEQIRGDGGADPIGKSGDQRNAHPSYGGALEDRLHRLQRELSALQRRVNAEIRALGSAAPKMAGDEVAGRDTHDHMSGEK